MIAHLGSFGPRRLVMIVALMLGWCALWGEITAANVIGGLATGALVTAPMAATPLAGGVRPLPLARLIGLIVVDLTRSTVQVAREILTPTDRTDELVVDLELPPGRRGHMLLLTVAITLTPGTAVIDAAPSTGFLRIHLLHADQRDATIAHVHRLAEVATEAMPAAEGVAP